MDVSVAPKSLRDIAHDAAAGEVICEYMEARGIKTAATLALLSKDEAALETTLIEPLLQGWRRADGTVLTVAESDKPIARAVLMHMWMLSQQDYWATSQAAIKPMAPTQASAPESTPSGSTND